MKRNPWLSAPVFAAVVLWVLAAASFAGATPALAQKHTPKHKVTTTPELGGTWSGTYSGAFNGTFTLHWTQTTSGGLSGTITLTSPSGKYSVNGNVHGSAISFGAVGAGATYTGTVSGSTSMSGSYKSPMGGGSWSATKSTS